MNFTTSVTKLARLVGEANNVEYLFVLESVQPPIAIRSFRVGLEFLFEYTLLLWLYFIEGLCWVLV